MILTHHQNDRLNFNPTNSFSDSGFKIGQQAKTRLNPRQSYEQVEKYHVQDIEKADILVVDDRPDNLRLLSRLLTDRGYKVRNTLTAQMALKAAAAVAPDLILLDVKLPDGDGYDVCTRLKTNPETSQVPIIFISGLGDVEDKVKAFSVGGADYIIKPFKSEEVIARVEHQLKIQALQQQLAEQSTQLQQEVQDRRRAEEKYRSIFENAVEGIFQTTLDGQYFNGNPALAKLCGYDSPAQFMEQVTDITQLYVDANQRTEFLDLLAKNGSVSEFEVQIRRRDGSIIRVLEDVHTVRDPDGDILYFQGTIQDITQRKQTEETLQQSEAQLRQQARELQAALQELKKTQTRMIQNEKMSSLGQLVAGVAHEINNPISFIYGNVQHANTYTESLSNLLQLYQKNCPDPGVEIQAEAQAMGVDFLLADLPKLLDSMKVGAERVKRIVSSLRTFSHMDETKTKVVDLHRGIDDTLVILSSRLGEQTHRPAIEVVRNYGQVPPLRCYAGQLNQVFMNVVANAIDALESHWVGTERGRKAAGEKSANPAQVALKNRPRITIQTEKTTSDSITIRIANNGPSISVEDQARLFDPFFTTKPVGEGTGLGLAISYQIVVEKHQGQLSCRSIPEQHTEFVIELPLAPEHSIV